MRRTINQGDRLFSTKQLDCIVPYIEEWSSIVWNAHLVDGCHLSIEDTLAKIAEQKWLIGNNIQRFPKQFIEEVVKVCAGYKFEEQRSRSMRQYSEHYIVPHVHKKDFLNQLKATHYVCLKSIHQYSRALPYASIVFIFVCH